jgi:BirA family biotin operon repressor/biotin-[acetyl-CoA-carboxylase] ligase
LLNLDKYYTLFNEKKYESILQEWKKHSDTIGRKIRIELSNENIDGTASDVDESGFLIVKTDAGDIKKITSGNCLYFD